MSDKADAPSADAGRRVVGWNMVQWLDAGEHRPVGGHVLVIAQRSGDKRPPLCFERDTYPVAVEDGRGKAAEGRASAACVTDPAAEPIPGNLLTIEYAAALPDEPLPQTHRELIERLDRDPALLQAADEIPLLDLARAALRVFGHAITTTEEALLRRYLDGDRGADFWADVEAAGLYYAPPAEEAGKRPRRPKHESAPLLVGPPGAILAYAATHHEEWDPVRGTIALLSRYERADITLRLDASRDPLAAWEPSGGAETIEELSRQLAERGGVRLLFTALLCSHLAAQRPTEPIYLSELLPRLGYKRPSGRKGNETEYRRAFAREVLSHIEMGSRFVFEGPYWRRGKKWEGRTFTGRLYGIDHVVWEPQDELDGTRTPEAVVLRAFTIAEELARDPVYIESVGRLEELTALPATAAGNLAQAMLYTLRAHWRTGITKTTAYQPITRRRLVGHTVPDMSQGAHSGKVDPLTILDGVNPGRMLGHFDDAMKILAKGGHIDADADGKPRYTQHATRYRKDGREPWEPAAPGDKPQKWQDAWLGQRLTILPGRKERSALAGIRSAAHEARQRRPKKSATKRKPGA